jgi:hypothetical protein
MASRRWICQLKWVNKYYILTELEKFRNVLDFGSDRQLIIFKCMPMLFFIESERIFYSAFSDVTKIIELSLLEQNLRHLACTVTRAKYARLHHKLL